MLIRPWYEEWRTEIENYLLERIDTSMFILNNLENYGPYLNEHPNSGNIKVIYSPDGVLGVFCLTRRGNILANIRSDILDGYLVDAILDELVSEPVSIKGILGNWDAVSSIANAKVYSGIWSKIGYISKEPSYSLDRLSNDLETGDGIRLLNENDYHEWRNLRIAYLQETGLSQDLSESDFKEIYQTQAQAQMHWGLFEDNTLISITNMNSRYKNIGQVGGVYTIPEFRSRGLAKKVVRHQLADMKRVHGLDRAILFTGEDNIPAQKVYQRLGFTPQGIFGIVFSA
ncbi:MAG: GNAT family N-acetyltransferase [Oligoflexus sp.]